MFDLIRFQRSWLLLRSSLRVMVRSPKLLLFPAATFACVASMVLFYFALAVLLPSGHRLNEPAHWQAVAARWGHLQKTGPHTQQWQPNGAAYLYLVAAYLATMVGATFFNVAFYHEILEALAGERVSLRTGLAFAARRIRPILLWSLLAGAVGLLICTLERRSGFVGRIILRSIGMLWNVASIFVIPVMIRETDADPIRLLKTSAAILRKTWGEALIGYVGIAFGAWIVLVSSVVAAVGLVALSFWTHHLALMLTAGIGWLLAVVVLVYVVEVANDIYCCALYIYASEGVVPAPYNADLMDAAWRVRKP